MNDKKIMIEMKFCAKEVLFFLHFVSMLKNMIKYGIYYESYFIKRCSYFFKPICKTCIEKKYVKS